MNTEELIKKLNKYGLSQESNELNLLLNSKAQKSIRISNAGLVKAGKSSFFNALIDALEKEEFATGAARKTTINQEYKLNENMVLVDTPGIDAKDSDTEEAFKSFKTSDVILFLHNIKLGEFNKAEYDFINQLKECFVQADEFWKRALFIVTWIDEKERHDDYNKILEKMRNQLKELCGCKNPVIHTVSSKRYLKGAKEGKKTLIERSNIQNIKKEIFSIANMMEKEKVNLQEIRLNKVREKINTKLGDKRKQKQIRVNRANMELNNKKGRMKEEISKIYYRFGIKWKNIKNLIQQC